MWYSGFWLFLGSEEVEHRRDSWMQNQLLEPHQKCRFLKRVQSGEFIRSFQRMQIILFSRVNVCDKTRLEGV